MRPDNLASKIFLDSGDPAETKQALSLLGFLDGQTTNPSLVGKNPRVNDRLKDGKKFIKSEIDDLYKDVVTEISGMIPDGSVSIEVYADADTSADTMFKEGRKMFGWIPNAHIKYPTTAAGLDAAERSVADHMRVNMTLCFTQEQAAAVYAATKGAAAGDVFVSPFVGRLDDIGQSGMDLISNILTMYRGGDGHVNVLAASVRNQQHFMQSLALGAHIITAPFSVLKDWAEAGRPLPESSFQYETADLQPIQYRVFDLDQPWRSFDIRHDLTNKGIEKFTADWNALIG